MCVSNRCLPGFHVSYMFWCLLPTSKGGCHICYMFWRFLSALLTSSSFENSLFRLLSAPQWRWSSFQGCRKLLSHYVIVAMPALTNVVAIIYTVIFGYEVSFPIIGSILRSTYCNKFNDKI